MIELVEKEGRLESEVIRTLLDFNMERKRLQKIIDEMSNGVMVTNEELEVTLHNRALVILLDLREEIKPRTAVSEIIKEETLVRTLKAILQRKLDAGAPVTQEIRVGQRMLRAASTPSIGLDRNVFIKFSGTVTTFEDITIPKELDRLRSDFANFVAEQLRSPALSIQKLGNMLAEELAGPLNKKQKALVEMIVKKAGGLLELINNLRNVAMSTNSSGPMCLPASSPQIKDFELI